MNVRRSQVGWGFGILWVLLNTLGWPIGVIAGWVLAEISEDGPWGGVLEEILAHVVFAAALGSVVGLMQWVVLRRQISKAGWWVLASVTGLAVSIGAGTAVAALIDGSFGLDDLAVLCIWTAVFALGGALIGVSQQLILRQQVSRASWWVLASTLGWALSIFVAGGFLLALDSQIGAFLVGGVVLGLVTVVAMVWLLRQPVPEA
jgi:serine/threonine-protein kinase